MKTIFAKNFWEIENFLEWNSLKILYIATKTCSTCEALFPKIENICENMDFVNLCRIEIENIPSVAGNFGVFSAPTILVFYEKKEYVRFDRYIRLNIFEEKICELKSLFEQKSFKNFSEK